MGEEIALENGRIFDFHGLVTLTLTSDRVILHTVMHHSSTSTYIPNVIEIEETLCGRTDVQMDGHLRPTNGMRLTRRSRPNHQHFNHFQDGPALAGSPSTLSPSTSARKRVGISYTGILQAGSPPDQQSNSTEENFNILFSQENWAMAIGNMHHKSKLW